MERRIRKSEGVEEKRKTTLAFSPTTIEEDYSERDSSHSRKRSQRG